MKGDFSRGFDPDRKRGRRYRRVLLQQGRVVLDSDFNAAVDAEGEEVRGLARDLGCRHGSPDLGFLITPGRLLALFDPRAGVSVTTTGGAEVVRDYGRKYLDRYPSLRMRAVGSAGTVTLPLLATVRGTTLTAFWLRADANATLDIAGTPVTVPVQPAFARLIAPLTDTAQVVIGLNPGEEVWLGLIETVARAGLLPSFAVAAGRYHLEGLAVEAEAGPIVLFDATMGPPAEPQGLTITRDDRHHLAGRHPGLRIEAPATAGGTVRLPFRFAVPGAATVDVWLRADAPTTIAVDGATSVNIATGAFAPVAHTLTNAQAINLTLLPGQVVWLALVELRHGAGIAPGLWPAVSYPAAAGFAAVPLSVPPAAGGTARSLANGDRLVIYLEAYERHLTAIEDPGLIERALGGHDTCTRTETLGQVKIAPALSLDADTRVAAGQALAAFASRGRLDGTLNIETAVQVEDPDPCAIPVAGGYVGADHRLYRFEVHRGGGLADTIIKWSRDNGAELFPVFALTSNTHIEVMADAPLKDGDLVELLSETIELGDADLARLDPAGGRVFAAARAAGDLVRLRDEGLTAGETRRVFRLRHRNDEAVDPSPAVDAARYGTPPVTLKVRRWHGLIEPSGGGTTFSAALEDGLQVTLAGSFEVGDWWQYEARTGRDNANGAWRASPHGPERLLAPLALVRFTDDTAPLELLAWLDERFPTPCNLDADDVPYDGGRVGSPSDTVQEALDELFSQPPLIVQASCGELIARIENGLQSVFDSIPTGGSAKVCITPGDRALAQTVTVADKGHIVVSGQGRATRLTSTSVNQILRFERCESVTIRDLDIEALSGAVGLQGTLSFDNCGEVTIAGVSVSNRMPTTKGLSAIRIETSDATRPAVRARVTGCTVRVGMGNIGILILNPLSADVTDNLVETFSDPVDLLTLLADQDMAAAVGNILVDRIEVGRPPGFNDGLLTPFGITSFGSDPSGRTRIVFRLNEWAFRLASFSTESPNAAPLLSPFVWRDVLMKNPLPGNARNVPSGWITANLRRLKAGLARRMFDLSAPPYDIPSSARPAFTELARRVTVSSALSSGHQGVAIGGDRAAGRPWNSSGNLHVLMGHARVGDIHITNNRLIGFRQGVTVAFSNNSPADRSRFLFAHRVVITGNAIDLRVPMFARRRHGIFVGHALSAEVKGNRIQVVQPAHPNHSISLPIMDGIRLWGHYGPLLHVSDNLTLDVWTGLRVNALNRNEVMSPPGGKSWIVANNAHFGFGVPTRVLI